LLSHRSAYICGVNKPPTFQVSLKLPFLEVSGTWAPDESERKAAWEMYVELITRVAVVELGPTEGSLREALSSLYSLFASTRDILRRYGPSVAVPSHGSDLTFGEIAVAVLNQGLRPLLSKWHPELAGYEATRPEGISPAAYEHAWSREAELRAELSDIHLRLREYADALSQAAGVPQLTVDAGPR
jgi:hypothetical protein